MKSLMPGILRSIKILTCRFFLITTASILCTDSGFAQSWKFIGGPQGIYSNDILFLKSGRLLCSTDQGMYYSDNNGDSWKFDSTNAELGEFHNLTQRLNGDILAVTHRGIACSKDMGQTWSMIYNVFYLNNYRVTIAESPVDSSLYYARDSLVYRSTDNGNSWKNIWTGNGVIRCYAINNLGEIFLGVDTGKLLRSTDKGMSFQPYSIGYSLDGLILEKILTNNSGGLYIDTYGLPDAILHYESNIVTPVYQTWTNPMLGVTDDGNLIYKAENRIALYNHVTRESSFSSPAVFVKDQYAQKAVTKGKVWVTSFSSYGLNRSTDGGYTWKDINNGIGYKECLSVSMTSKGTLLTGTFGFAFWGGLYKMLGDGRAWQNLNPGGTDAFYTKIDICSNGNIIAGGMNGIYISQDDGAHWEHSPGIYLVYSQYVSRKGTIYVADTDKKIWISHDNGLNFYPTSGPVNNYYIGAIGESQTGRIFARAIFDHAFFYSDDEGKTWNSAVPDPLHFQTVFDFTYKNDTVYAATTGGIYFSTNNGLTWKQDRELYLNVSSIRITRTGDIAAAGKVSGLYFKKDNVQKWEELNSGLMDLNINDLYLDNNDILYAATNTGIYRINLNKTPVPLLPQDQELVKEEYVTLTWDKNPYSDKYHLQISTDSLFQLLILDNENLKGESYTYGPVKPETKYFWRVANITNGEDVPYSSARSFLTSVPHRFSLVQNFPNPFNPVTTIRYTVPYASHIKLKIYDSLGQQAAVLIDKIVEAGGYEYTWNGSDYPSGVYLIRLEAGNYVETKKMMLLK